jgi:hypothetical protein
MSSIREMVLAAVVTALGATGTPATGGVFRSQLDQLRQSQLPCYDVSPGEEKITDEGDFGDHESITRKLPIMVRALVDAGTAEGEDANPAINVDDSALDPFYVFAVKQLIGNKANLGGVAINVEEISSSPVFRPEGRDLIGLEMTFEVTFATKRGDPTQKG